MDTQVDEVFNVQIMTSRLGKLTLSAQYRFLSCSTNVQFDASVRQPTRMAAPSLDGGLR